MTTEEWIGLGEFIRRVFERRDRIRRMTTNYHRRQRGWKT